MGGRSGMRKQQREYLAGLERVIVDAVSGMDPEDSIGTVKVHYASGPSRWLVDVIKAANDVREEIRNGRT